MRRPNCIFWSNRCLRTAHEKSWLAEKKSETVFFLSKIEVTVSCAPAKPKKPVYSSQGHLVPVSNESRLNAASDRPPRFTLLRLPRDRAPW